MPKFLYEAVVDAEQWTGPGHLPTIVKSHPHSWGEGPCIFCGKEWEVHGWVEIAGIARTICPGEWVVTRLCRSLKDWREASEGVRRFLPIRPEQFKWFFEPIDIEEGKWDRGRRE